MSSPAAVVLELAPPLGHLPNEAGPALYALVLDLIGGHERTLLHDATKKALGIHLVAPGRLRIGTLDPFIAGRLVAAVQAGPARRLLGQERRIALAAAHPWSPVTGPPARDRWTVRFRSPTTFRTSRGQGVRRPLPYPAPELVFTALADKWDRLADDDRTRIFEPLPARTCELAGACLYTAAHSIHTERHLVSTRNGRHYDTGFVGEVTFAVARPGLQDPALRGLPDATSLRGLEQLLGLAAVVGVGDRTHLGMGWLELTG